MQDSSEVKRSLFSKENYFVKQVFLIGIGMYFVKNLSVEFYIQISLQYVSFDLNWFIFEVNDLAQWIST